MPKGDVYILVLACIALATLVPSFFVARSKLPLRYAIGYLAGIACGVVVLIAESYLAGGIWWNDVFYALGLPILGVIAAASFKSPV
jgi:hypothetical protein